MRQIIHQQMKHDVGRALMVGRRLDEPGDKMGLPGADIGNFTLQLCPFLFCNKQVWVNINMEMPDRRGIYFMRRLAFIVLKIKVVRLMIVQAKNVNQNNGGLFMEASTVE